jgi:leucyl aminopeptidase
MKVSFAKPGSAAPGALAVGIFSGLELTPSVAMIDRKTRGALSRAIAAGRFRGKTGQILSVIAPRGVGARSILVAGLGKPAEFNDLAAERVGRLRRRCRPRRDRSGDCH